MQEDNCDWQSEFGLPIGQRTKLYGPASLTLPPAPLPPQPREPKSYQPRVASSGPRYPPRRSNRLQGVKLEDGALCELSSGDEGDGGNRRSAWGLLDLMGERAAIGWLALG